ncbi:rho GDP-dissociation inhibitor 2-like [Sinocyclocheilus rhinocerous]|uniref:rho GDP-dissociation inhibitor 2-like n=1 Tax=Sinocyclocheilus rhinocerous TaxID=307959 RepID=UPI0007B95E1C|nr:PREDICTED: rho GDP-dissociation inhibitor 2-like [Sinocyclocheilus rhinocerous]
MLGLDVCEFGGQFLELLWLTVCYRGIMADKDKDVPVVEDEDEPDLNYQPPAQKSLQEIQELDKDDESLNKYKQTLLGSGPVVADPSIPNVQVTRLTLMCDQAPGPITMDLTVDKAVYMVGSYGPRAEEHEFITPVEEAPKGMIVRGTYHIKSYFTDDDKTDHLSWEWNLQIKKDWDSAE